MTFLDIIKMASLAIGVAGIFAGIIWVGCVFCDISKAKRLRIFCWTWYLTTLGYVTLFRYGLDMSLQFENIDQSINLIPIMNTFKLWENGSILVFFYNIIGNLLWFLPMGLLIASGSLSLKKCLLVAFAISSLIEIFQTILHIGTTDIDDVIFNVLGALIGYLWMYYILNRKKCTCTNC